MCVDAHIPCGAGQGLSFSVRDVLLGFGVSVLLGHAEVDDVDNVGRFRVGTSDEEIVRLDVAIDEVLFVDGLYSRQLQRRSI